MLISTRGNAKFRCEVCVTFEGRTVCKNGAAPTAIWAPPLYPRRTSCWSAPDWNPAATAARAITQATPHAYIGP